MTRPTVSRTRPAPPRRPGVRDGSSWRIPSALVILSLIPVVAGSLRLLEIAGGPQLLATNPRVDAAPAPVVAHVLAAAVYAVLGAFQFSARLRAYALGVGAGTQAFTQGAGEALFGTGELSTALSVSAGWVVNATVAEWIIRRPGARRAWRARVRRASAGSR